MVVIEEIEETPTQATKAPASAAAAAAAAAGDAVAVTEASAAPEPAPEPAPELVHDPQEDAAQARRAQAEQLKVMGNEFFAKANYEDAISQYLDAVQISEPKAPEVAVYKANIAACHMKLDNFDDAIQLCTEALEIDAKYVKALVRRAQARERLGGLEHLSAALEDYKAVIEIDKGNAVAQKAITQLTPRVDEEREKQKNEMLGKLKDLGNTILGKFGLSTDNFKFEKDPNTGSYSVNFVNNANGASTSTNTAPSSSS